jgi:hypothetical protein
VCYKNPPVINWHDDAKRHPCIKVEDGVAYRYFRTTLDRRYFKSPSVAIDAKAFRSAMKTATALILCDQHNWDAYLFRLEHQRAWGTPLA